MPPTPRSKGVKTWIDRFVAHVKRNQTAWTVGAICGATVITHLVIRRAVIINTVAPVFNNDNSSLVNLGGYTTKIVTRPSDGKTWLKVTDAAKDVGVSLYRMSRHLNGHEPHVFGETYKIAGIGTTG